MLFYSNNQLVFDFEMGTELRYTGNSSAFCSKDSIENFFRNITIADSIDIDKLQAGIICALSPNQMLGFIEDWRSHVFTHNLYEWTAKDWFIEFFGDIKEAYIQLDGDINGDNPFHPQLSLDIVKNIDLENICKNEEHFIKLNNKTIYPEFSWAVEDCLYCRKKNIPSQYSIYVNSIINKNIKRNKHYATKLNLFSKNTGQIFHYASSFDIMTSEISQNIIEILHSPYPQNCVRTSVTHLNNVLEAFLNETSG